MCYEKFNVEVFDQLLTTTHCIVPLGRTYNNCVEDSEVVSWNYTSGEPASEKVAGIRKIYITTVFPVIEIVMCETSLTRLTKDL